MICSNNDVPHAQCRKPTHTTAQLFQHFVHETARFFFVLGFFAAPVDLLGGDQQDIRLDDFLQPFLGRLHEIIELQNQWLTFHPGLEVLHP